MQMQIQIRPSKIQVINSDPIHLYYSNLPISIYTHYIYVPYLYFV